MICTRKIEVTQSYAICKSNTIIDDVCYRDYGIILSQFNNGNVFTVARVEGISVEKSVVITLINRLLDEDVDPSFLHYIVEDYLGEISTI